MTVQSQFFDHLTQHSERTGFVAPNPLLVYLSELLAQRLDRVELIPEPSFAERYLELYSCHRLSEFKDYADSALFFVSLLPKYGERRGLDMEYYASLGISVYYTLGDLAKDSRYVQLGNWFYHLQKFLYTALHDQTDLELVILNKNRSLS
jgi:hypothetical protein